MTAWYVVHTHANAEAKALTHLTRQGYDAYLPRQRRWRRHARRRELVLRPLFPRYLFVAHDLFEMPWRPILSTVGVSGLVRRGDRPAPVPPGVVEEIREQERLHAFDQTGDARKLHAGDQVRVMNGPFADLMGKFCGLADRERVFVLLDMLGREVRTCLAVEAVAPA